MFTRYLSHFFLFRQHLKTRTKPPFPTTSSKNLFRFSHTARTKPPNRSEQKTHTKCLISMSIYSIIIVSRGNVSTLMAQQPRKLFNTSRRREPHRKVGNHEPRNNEATTRNHRQPNSAAWQRDYHGLRVRRCCRQCSQTITPQRLNWVD